MDDGTRGCPIKEGVVLAGSKQEEKAKCFVIMELGCIGTPVEFSLPYSYAVHSLAMAYDKDTKMLTVAGGVRYNGNSSTSIAEVWQLKLYEQGSKWQSLPDLPFNVFDPVLISCNQTLYVVGGYTSPALGTGLDNASKQCVKLPLDKSDGKWSYINELKKPLDHKFGGRGVLIFGNITVFATKHVQRHNIYEKSWKINDLKNDRIVDCTPVVDPEGNLFVSRRYISAKRQEEQDIAAYNFDTNKWAPTERFGVFPDDQFDTHHGAGRLLILKLDGTNVRGKTKRTSKVSHI